MVGAISKKTDCGWDIIGMVHTNSVEDISDDKMLATESEKTDFLADIFPEVVSNLKSDVGVPLLWSWKVTSKSTGASRGTEH